MHNITDLPNYLLSIPNILYYLEDNIIPKNIRDSSVIIALYILHRQKVDYLDDSNFIYLANNKTEHTSEPLYALELYLKFYNEETITYQTDFPNITSFPIYPRMIHCTIKNHKFTTFHVQPNMIYCDLSYGKLSSFPVQPKMTICKIEHNTLKSFEVQPEMIKCYLNYNNLETFPIQIKMEICHLHYNKLTFFPVQPSMITCDITYNNLLRFPVQPKMIRCRLDRNKLTTFPSQPCMILCTLTDNDLHSFPLEQESLIFCKLNGNKNLPLKVKRRWPSGNIRSFNWPNFFM